MRVLPSRSYLSPREVLYEDLEETLEMAARVAAGLDQWTPVRA